MVVVNPHTTDGPEITGAAGAAPTVTSTVNGTPEQPLAEVGVTVYSTTPCTLPVLVSTSAIAAPQPPGQSLFPITPPTITAEVHVNCVPATVEFNGTFVGSPLQITMFVADPTGVAPTVSVSVNALPAQPAADVGMIVYTTVSSVLPVLVNVSDMVEPQFELQFVYPETFADEPLAVHVNVVVPVVPADKLAPVISPLHKNSSPEVVPAGEGLTVIVDKNVLPAQPAAETGVIV